jgi:hypothetical protein
MTTMMVRAVVLAAMTTMMAGAGAMTTKMIEAPVAWPAKDVKMLMSEKAR